MGNKIAASGKTQIIHAGCRWQKVIAGLILGPQQRREKVVRGPFFDLVGWTM